jgi:hypothetical protein
MLNRIEIMETVSEPPLPPPIPIRDSNPAGRLFRNGGAKPTRIRKRYMNKGDSSCDVEAAVVTPTPPPPKRLCRAMKLHPPPTTKRDNDEDLMKPWWLRIQVGDDSGNHLDWLEDAGMSGWEHEANAWRTTSIGSVDSTIDTNSSRCYSSDASVWSP